MRLNAVASIANSPQLTEIACTILGKMAFPYRATVFEKSPGSNWLVVWHQDTALPVFSRIELAGWGPWSIKEGVDYAHAPASVLAQVLALRVHLDDSNADNGPLRVLPGTHVYGVLSDDRIHELATQVRAVSCLVPKGGVLAMSPLLIHASSKLNLESPRRVLHIEYAASDCIVAPLHLAIA